ncbi:MAG: hypothetical protein KDB14_18570 [Planctomycetales bacterium]|nr:hypothetical protein [Planctomycetales bacterium]
MKRWTNRARPRRSRLLLRVIGFALAIMQIAFTGSISIAQEGWLQQLRGEVDEPPTDPNASTTTSAPPAKSKRRHHHDDCDDDDDDSFFGTMIGYGLTSPFWLPPAMIGDDYQQAMYFSPAPNMQSPGLMVTEEWVQSQAVTGFPWMARVRGEFGLDLDNLDQVRLQWLVDTSSRIGVDGTITYRHESLAIGDDQAMTGDANLLFRFAQSPTVQMRSGIGINWFSDRTDADVGFNFTYSGDFFLAKPWVVSSEIDWGTLGDSSLFHFRGTVGAVWRGLEVFTGYDHYGVDGLKTDQWISGLGFWF